jgi:hypothetical protein
MNARRFSSSWLFCAVGSGCILSALLWQPAFQHELTTCGLVALLVAAARRLAQR